MSLRRFPCVMLVSLVWIAIISAGIVYQKRMLNDRQFPIGCETTHTEVVDNAVSGAQALVSTRTCKSGHTRQIVSLKSNPAAEAVSIYGALGDSPVIVKWVSGNVLILETHANDSDTFLKTVLSHGYQIYYQKP